MDAKTFDVFSVLEGREMPEDTVTVYTDEVSYRRYVTLNRAANDAVDGEQANEIDAQLDELREKIKASALTIHMRGYLSEVQEAIVNATRAQFKIDAGEMIDTDTEAFYWLNLRSICESVVKIVNANGEEDARHFSVDDIKKLKGLLAPEEFDKIAAKHFELVLEARAFDQAVSPDFS